MEHDLGRMDGCVGDVIGGVLDLSNTGYAIPCPAINLLTPAMRDLYPVWNDSLQSHIQTIPAGGTMMKKLLFGTLIALSLILLVAAAPVTNAPTDVSCRSVTFNAAGGAAGLAWFEWGPKTGGPYIWTTPNQTIGAGGFTDYQWGPPLLTCTTYYVRACDTTGCGAEQSFSTPAASPINQTHFGSDVVQIMRGGFNISQTAAVIVKPFSASFPSPVSNAVPYGLVFFFILSGMWLRGRDMLIPTMISMVSGGMIWLGGSALGVPPEFVVIGQTLVYIGIGGFIWSLFTR